MKRVAVNSNQSHFVGEEASAVYSYKKKRLIEDYLEVQKEFVLKKKRLQMAKQKREILSAEVSFLRRRHNHLKLRSQQLEAKQGLVRPENSSAQRKSLRENEIRGFNEASPNSLPPVYVAHPILGYEDQDSEKKAEDGMNSLRVEKQCKNHAITEKRVGKKKISWQDQVGLKV